MCIDVPDPSTVEFMTADPDQRLAQGGCGCPGQRSHQIKHLSAPRNVSERELADYEFMRDHLSRFQKIEYKAVA